MAKSSKKRKDTDIEKKQTRKQIAMGRKEARQNRIILILVGALALIIVTILVVGVVQELLIKPNKPVATVNGTKINTDDYQELVTYNRYNQYMNIGNLQEALDGLAASPEENEFLISFYEQQLGQLQSSLALLPQTTLDELIDDTLIQQKAEADGITVSDQEVDEALDSDLESILSPEPQEPITGTADLPTPEPVTQQDKDDLYNLILSNMTLTDKAFRTIIQRNLLRGKVQEAMAAQVPTTGEVHHVQLIQTETEEEAVTAQTRIEAGEDFAVVAQEVSTDTLSVEQGGDLGWVAEGMLSQRYGQDLETYAFDLEIGTLGVVESNGMFYVVLVVERDENGPLPAEVLTPMQNSALLDWLDEQKASPDVEIERSLDPDQIPEDPFAQLLQGGY